MYISTQSVYDVAGDIAKEYKLPREQVHVICEYIGGGFGSKLSLRPETKIAIELARQAGAPVKVALDRREEMNVGGYRPGAYIELSASITDAFPNLEVRAYADSGLAYSSFIANHIGNFYKGPRRSVTDVDVISNHAPGCSFRSPGGPNAAFALEQTLDALAHQQDLDPVAFRRGFDRGDSYQALYDWVGQLPVWRERRPAGEQEGRFRTGLGVAFGRWYHFYVPDAEVEVGIDERGIFARTATQDMGQGTRTVLARAVAGVFGLPPSDIRVEIGHSNYVRGPSSGGSRTAVTLFAPAREAAGQLRARLTSDAENKLGLRQPAAVAGGVAHGGGTTPWSELLPQLAPAKATARRGRNGFLDLLGLSGMVLPGGLALATGGSTSAYVIEVEVDTLLGHIRVPRTWGAVRAGRIYAPELARSQCYGAVAQSIGLALYEERHDCPNTGRLLTHNLEDYHLTGIGDMPEIQIDFVGEEMSAKGGGIGLGEVVTVPVAAAVANAVFNATGWRPLQTPIRPDRLLDGLTQLHTKTAQNLRQPQNL